MKRLLYLTVVAFTLKVSAQPFPVKNVNDEYFVTSLYNSDILKKELHEFVRDKNGLYWFQFFTDIYSFDGVNWKSYQLKTINGSNNPFRINEMEVTEDGNVWLGTENGFFVFDPSLDCFVPVKQKFPGIKNLPYATNCTFQGPPGTFIFLSFAMDGFFVFDVNSKKVQRIIIDSVNRAFISTEGQQVTVDKKGNIWGTTKDKRGVWHYDLNTGKMRCSWRGELSQFSDNRYRNFINLTYAEKDNSLWIAHATNRYLEKMNLTTGKSDFYSFSGDLKVQPDTNNSNRHNVIIVKIDRDKNEWINVAGRYIVKLNNDISRMEYLCNDKELFPVGDLRLFKPETPINNDRNDVLLWVWGFESLSMIRKRADIVRHIYFDTLSATGLKPKDYLNTGRQNIFFERGRDNNYFLLQQNPGRPKLICMDKELRFKKVFFNDEWNQYPAYFNPEFDQDTLYIALLRPDTEPLDFRNIVLKDFCVDLHSLNVKEVKLDFFQRIRYYGLADKWNVYWLYSDGYLFSYDTKKRALDSIFICKPASKGSNTENLVKGYDYPKMLHKSTSTFWISFYPSRELYKINLISKKIDKVFRPCMDQKDCNVPGVIYGMYNFDSSNIYLKSSLHAMLLNARNDSVTGFSNIFRKKLPVDNPVGAETFREWIMMIFPTHIYLLNKVSGTQRELVLDEDFKWRLGQIRSKPLVNENGDILLMSSINKGFILFNIDSPTVRTKPGKVTASYIKVDNQDLLIDSLLKNKGLALKYNSYNNIQVGFSDYTVFVPGKMNYEYALYKGSDTNWNKINGKPELTFSDLSAGRYQLLLRASNIYGDYSEKISSFTITIFPPYWQTWWFRGLIFAVIGFVFYGLYRYRVQQLQRLQAIRNHIASDLHDDIGSTLNSISIYSEVAKQQAGKEIPALEMIGLNSRKIIESMSDIVWTINPENDSFEKIIIRMRSFAYQLLKAKKVEYTFEVDEKLNSVALPMQVRKNFYLVFKEAITNVVKYSEASRVSILLYEKNKFIMLRIRDNGKGIPVNAQTLGNGLMNMTRRAKEISAELNIISANSGGTEIELMLKT
jgi:two-component sensor histidine kinase